jgi:hypothetical protein
MFWPYLVDSAGDRWQEKGVFGRIWCTFGVAAFGFPAAASAGREISDLIVRLLRIIERKCGEENFKPDYARVDRRRFCCKRWEWVLR